MPRYEDDDSDDDYEDEPPRRSRPPQRRQPDLPARRDTLIERRMRAACGEEYEYDDDRSSYRSTANYAPRYPQPTSGGMTVVYMLLGIAAVAALAFILAPRLIGSMVPSVNIPAAIQQVVATPTPTLIDRGGTILQIRNLNRLETQQFSADRIIEAKIERGNPLDLVLADRLIFIASGTVISGVDMSKIGEQDVTLSADGKTIAINLPPSEIFIRTLDNERSRVYDRQTGILAKADPALETQARQEGEAQILVAACEANVMQKAADEASRSLKQFLTLAGFQTVTVNVRAGECVAPPTVPVQ